ncbi:Uncharacterised protein [Mycobacterium tuberculosis]|uniref:Uncharacterized protein n=1 Tax=Mycobacterium tuberculosis TaxID=1773 RepID=A0A0U0UQ04_MYCTX|nr:Uncharacterised protein [Mycobacterium tuberculosis]CPA93491.1 Uncharacterised protein [Mycobacterium tuberculosis]
MNRAQPLDTSTAAHSAASPDRTNRVVHMTDRLRTLWASPPPAGVRTVGMAAQLGPFGGLVRVNVRIVWRKRRSNPQFGTKWPYPDTSDQFE